MSLQSTLKSLVADPDVVMQSRVLSVTDSTIVLATAQGRREFQVPNPGAYAVGTLVRHTRLVVLGRTLSDAEVPIYPV